MQSRKSRRGRAESYGHATIPSSSVIGRIVDSAKTHGVSWVLRLRFAVEGGLKHIYQRLLRYRPQRDSHANQPSGSSQTMNEITMNALIQKQSKSHGLKHANTWTATSTQAATSFPKGIVGLDTAFIVGGHRLHKID